MADEDWRKKVHVTDHPLVRAKLSIIRDKKTDSKVFRELVYEIGLYVGYQATSCLATNVEKNNDGHFGTFASHRLAQKVAFVPIMRGGIGLTTAMLELIPTAPVLHLGIFRDKITLQPVEYYNKLPQSNSFDVCYIIDPMIATGGTVIAAIDMLKDLGVPKIHIITVCASEVGTKNILERHPHVEIHAAALDPELNSHGYIIPGLGDAGDRLYNTQYQQPPASKATSVPCPKFSTFLGINSTLYPAKVKSGMAKVGGDSNKVLDIQSTTQPPSSEGNDKNDVLSDSDDGNVIEVPEEDAFMFRKMGKKFRARLRKFTDTLLLSSRREKEEEEAVGALPKQARTGSDELLDNTSLAVIFDPEKVLVDDISTLLWSAFRIPLYQLERDEYGRRGIPMILALLKVSIVQPVEEAKSYSPNVAYEIHLSYGSLCWSINRRIYDMFRLHTILMLRHLQGHLPVSLPHFPSQLAYIVDSTILKSGTKKERRDNRIKASTERRLAVEKYLTDLLRVLNMQGYTNELYEFLECSRLSLSLIPDEVGIKLKEGYLRTRIFRTQHLPALWACLLCKIPERKKYRTKWFVVKSSYIALVDRIDQASPTDVMLCDKGFHVIVENESARQFLRPLTVKVINSSRKMEVRPGNNPQMNYWLDAFRRLAAECIWCQSHRFNSYAPVRSGCRMEWLIDGEQYYTELVRAIQGAKEEIYLHGWWISPELFLVRPPSAHPHMRLDRLLQKKAKEGVKIYILIFKEFSMALSLNSQHTKVSFEKLHPNIRVQRHPDHLGGILYWAHHEKVVVVDQRVAFTGGLDICFGRYDSVSHPLVDHYPKEPQRQVWSGLDYSNPRIRDFRNVMQHTTALVDRSAVPRMPWHDVAIVLYGAPARDLGRHFIERWNFVKSQKAMHKEEHIPFLLPKPEYTLERLEAEGFTGTVKIQATRSGGEWSMGTSPETSVYKAYLHYIENSQHFIYIENQFFISRSSEHQTSPIKNRIAQAIVERIIRAHAEGKPFRIIVFLPLMPAFEASSVDRSDASTLRIIMQAQYSAISRGPHSILGQLSARGIAAEEYICFYSLRKYGFLQDKAITEQLYIHSKLLLVDDRVAIMGSANINDRSMLGVRDSELAVIVEDEDLVTGTLNGQSVPVARKIQELRMRLLQEHLGLLHLPSSDPQVQLLLDPMASEFYHGVLRRQAALNTQIFRELFHCVPDDCVDSWEEYRRFTETPRVHVVDDKLGINSLEMLDSIRGSVVLFPTQFLRDEDLAASMLTPEFLIPVEVYL